MSSRPGTRRARERGQGRWRSSSREAVKRLRAIVSSAAPCHAGQAGEEGQGRRARPTRPLNRSGTGVGRVDPFSGDSARQSRYGAQLTPLLPRRFCGSFVVAPLPQGE